MNISHRALGVAVALGALGLALALLGSRAGRPAQESSLAAGGLSFVAQGPLSSYTYGCPYDGRGPFGFGPYAHPHAQTVPESAIPGPPSP